MRFAGELLFDQPMMLEERGRGLAVLRERPRLKLDICGGVHCIGDLRGQ